MHFVSLCLVKGSKLQASLVAQLCNTPCQDQQRRVACLGRIVDETEASLGWKPANYFHVSMLCVSGYAGSHADSKPYI